MSSSCFRFLGAYLVYPLPLTKPEGSIRSSIHLIFPDCIIAPPVEMNDRVHYIGGEGVCCSLSVGFFFLSFTPPHRNNTGRLEGWRAGDARKRSRRGRTLRILHLSIAGACLSLFRVLRAQQPLSAPLTQSPGRGEKNKADESCTHRQTTNERFLGT